MKSVDDLSPAVYTEHWMCDVSCSSTFITRMRPDGGATSRIGRTCSPRRDTTTRTWRRPCSTRLQTTPHSLTHSKPPPTTWTFTRAHAELHSALISTRAHQTPGYRDTKYEPTAPSVLCVIWTEMDSERGWWERFFFFLKSERLAKEGREAKYVCVF